MITIKIVKLNLKLERWAGWKAGWWGFACWRVGEETVRWPGQCEQRCDVGMCVLFMGSESLAELQVCRSVLIGREISQDLFKQFDLVRVLIRCRCRYIYSLKKNLLSTSYAKNPLSVGETMMRKTDMVPPREQRDFILLRNTAYFGGI